MLGLLVPTFATAVIAAVTVTVKVINNTTDLKISNVKQELFPITSQLDQLGKNHEEVTKTLNELSNTAVSLQATLEELGRKEVATTTRLEDIKALEAQLVAVNTTIGAFDERIKQLDESSKSLSTKVAEVDKKIFGTEAKSQNVENIVAKVSNEVESINSEMDTQSDQLEIIADVVKTGFEDDPKVEPLLKHIAKNEQQSTEEIVETIGQLKVEHNNDPDQVSDKMSAELGIASETARAAADERLSAHQLPAFFEMIPAAAKDGGSGSDLTINPFAGITIKADPRGESIVSICKRYQAQVATDLCYDFFLERHSAINGD